MSDMDKHSAGTMSTPVPSTPGPAPTASVPPSTGRSSSVLDCSTDASTFKQISIHTAKCAKCDERNKATMLRCRGCTYQVCAECVKKMDGKPLSHGNASSSPAGLPVTPARRRLFAAVPIAMQMQGDATPSSETRGTAAGISALAISGHAGTEQSPTPARANGADVTSPAAQPTGAMTTPPTTGSGKRPRKARKNALARDYSSDEEELEVMSDIASPTPASKRRKTIGQVKEKYSPDSANGSPALPARRSTRAPAQSPVPKSNTLRGQPTLAPSLEMPHQQERGEVAGPAMQQTHHRDISIDQLLNQAGVEYKDEHLLGRHIPVVQNPVIHVPESIRRGGKSRSSPEQIQKNFQEKAREAWEELQPATDDNSSKLMVRTFVKTKADQLLQGKQLNNNQRDNLNNHMLDTAEALIIKFHSELSVAIRRSISMDLNTEMEMFTEQQKEEIAKAVIEKGTRFLKDSEDMSSKKAGHLPPVGYFSVTPSKKMKFAALGDLQKSDQVVAEPPSPTAAVAEQKGVPSAGTETLDIEGSVAGTQGQSHAVVDLSKSD